MIQLFDCRISFTLFDFLQINQQTVQQIPDQVGVRITGGRQAVIDDAAQTIFVECSWWRRRSWNHANQASQVVDDRLNDLLELLFLHHPLSFLAIQVL